MPVLGTNDVIFGKELLKAPKAFVHTSYWTLSTRGHSAPKTGSEYYAEKTGKFSTADASGRGTSVRNVKANK